MSKSKKSTRSVLQGPEGFTQEQLESMTFFDYLSKCTPNPLERLANSAMRSSAAPLSMYPDLQQEIYLHWYTMKPDLTHAPGEIASYAKQAAYNHCLEYLREHGAPVRLPGNAFRKRKSDGKTYVQPGMLAAPIDFNALDDALNADDAHLHPDAIQARASELDLPADELKSLTALVDSSNPADVADQSSAESELAAYRQQLVKDAAAYLTTKHYLVLMALLDGKTVEDIKAGFSLRQQACTLLISEASYVLRLVEDGKDPSRDSFVLSMLKREAGI